MRTKTEIIIKEWCKNNNVKYIDIKLADGKIQGLNLIGCVTDEIKLDLITKETHLIFEKSNKNE